VRGGGSSYAFTHGFQGMAFDSVAGLSHQRARWYSPSLGRWVTMDPIRYQAGDVNLYGFVGNHVTGAVDPTGLQKDQPRPDMSKKMEELFNNLDIMGFGRLLVDLPKPFTPQEYLFLRTISRLNHSPLPNAVKVMQQDAIKALKGQLSPEQSVDAVYSAVGFVNSLISLPTILKPDALIDLIVRDQIEGLNHESFQHRERSQELLRAILGYATLTEDYVLLLRVYGTLTSAAKQRAEDEIRFRIRELQKNVRPLIARMTAMQMFNTLSTQLHGLLPPPLSNPLFSIK
jgi:RHS repeat-associated protein